MKLTRALARGLLALSLPLWIAACASSGPPAPAPVEVRTIEVKVPTFVALDPVLTAYPPEPAAPVPQCVDGAFLTPVMCNRQHADYTDALKTWGRSLRERLDAIGRVQPPAAEPDPEPGGR